MKTIPALAFVVGVSLSCDAATVPFDLSPPGTSPGVGLSGSNVVPAVASGAGSGNEISGGILLNSTNFQLSLAVGYGSAAGFSDLSGAATALHIHAPASVVTNAPVLIDLSPLNFTATNPGSGGVIFGSVAFPTNSVSNLLAGLAYLDIHTIAHPDGEIRGQLVVAVSTNGAPTISCPASTTVECDGSSEITILVSDPEGEAMTVVWRVNGTAVQTNNVPPTHPPTAVNLLFVQRLPLGTNQLDVSATDASGDHASCHSTLVVVDTVPPVIDSLLASPNVLWPPNHKMIPVRVRAQVTDACGWRRWKIIAVTSNEPVRGRGDGNTAPDWKITSDHTVQLRAERSGRAPGRIYTITVQATDNAGNLSVPKNVTVSVPKSRGNNNVEDDDSDDNTDSASDGSNSSVNAGNNGNTGTSGSNGNNGNSGSNGNKGNNGNHGNGNKGNNGHNKQ